MGGWETDLIYVGEISLDLKQGDGGRRGGGGGGGGGMGKEGRSQVGGCYALIKAHCFIAPV